MLKDFFHDAGSILIPVAAAVVTVVFTAWLGMWTYYRQREYELVKRRYLDEGVDLLSEELENALIVFRHNWSFVLRTLYRAGASGRFPVYDDTSERLAALSHDQLQVRPAHRVAVLVGDQVFWQLIQRSFGFVQTSGTYYLRIVLEETARIFATTDDPIALKQRCDQGIKQVMDLEIRSQHYYPALTYLQDLGKMLEAQRYTFASMRKFKSRPEVVKLVESAKRYLESMPSLEVEAASDGELGAEAGNR